jgi:GH18 family chitinase
MLWHAGVPPSQVVLGLGFYGRSFTLANPECTSPGCPIAGTGELGYCLQTPGILSLTEIKGTIDHRNLKPDFDKTAAMKWISWDDQW